MDFNNHKDDYCDLIEKSLRYSGKNLDFFAAVKASYLNTLISQHLSNTTMPVVLDVGCGHGLIHKYLDSYGYKTVGVDMAHEVLQLAQKSNPSVDYFAYDGYRLPFQSANFDVAIAICVMHHVPEQQWHDFLVEIQRVVKNNGLVVIFEHHPYHPITRYIVAKNPLDEDAVLLSKHRLQMLMRETGFKNIESRFILFTPFAHLFFRWLEKKLSRFPLGTQYYTVATV